MFSFVGTSEGQDAGERVECASLIIYWSTLIEKVNFQRSKEVLYVKLYLFLNGLGKYLIKENFQIAQLPLLNQIVENRVLLTALPCLSLFFKELQNP